MMEKKVRSNVAIALAGIVTIAPLFSGSALAGDAGWYLGAGIGISEMEPNTKNTRYSIDDERDFGGKIYLGYGLSKRWNVEGYYSDLGEVTIKPNGSIGYTDMGVSALYYFHGSNAMEKGLSAFVRGGVGRMNNDTALPYQRDNDNHLMYGAGFEYGFGNGVVLRADLDLYDEDSRLLTVGLRFGLGAEEAPASEPKPVVVPVVEAEPVIVADPEPAPEPDTDGDGVLDINDSCPGTATGVQVDGKGCEIERVIVLKGVTFGLNSNELAGESETVLDEVVETLQRYPDQKVEIAGYTDSQGNAAYNRDLSQRRADAVRDYLMAKGVAAEQLTAVGFGEEDPIADNATAEGRALNRRVEMHLLD